jgi:hypothetical protein
MSAQRRESIKELLVEGLTRPEIGLKVFPSRKLLADRETNRDLFFRDPRGVVYVVTVHTSPNYNGTTREFRTKLQGYTYERYHTISVFDDKCFRKQHEVWFRGELWRRNRGEIRLKALERIALQVYEKIVYCSLEDQDFFVSKFLQHDRDYSRSDCKKAREQGTKTLEQVFMEERIGTLNRLRLVPTGMNQGVLRAEFLNRLNLESGQCLMFPQ